MAHQRGSRHFLAQRLTALLLLPLVVYLVILLVSMVGADHATVAVRLSMPVVWVPMLGLVLAGVWHMWLGMQVVIDDYARGGSRSTLQMLSTVLSIATALACLYAVYLLNSGA
ncbi:MAG: succinate dehydrogenase, hydrophobic membrane anchor protein [Hyphomicrobiaceae bacterium]